MRASPYSQWLARGFLLDEPTDPHRRSRATGGYLFTVRRYSLEVATLHRDITWVSGACGPRVQLRGLARFSGAPLKVCGPRAGHSIDLRSTWIRIQGASDRRDRANFSTLEICVPRDAENHSIHSELVLFVEPAKLADLISHLEASDGKLTLHFMLETEDGVTVSSSDRASSLPVYDIAFQLQQSALNGGPGDPMLPQLQHALEHCVPAAIRGTTQLEEIATEMATSLSRSVMNDSRAANAEYLARAELGRWLNDIQTTFHGRRCRQDASAINLYSLQAEEFAHEVGLRDRAEQPSLIAAYGQVWAHSPVRSGRHKHQQPELDRYQLAPDPDLLESLATRYCEQSRMHSPSLEWCLANALLRMSICSLERSRCAAGERLRKALFELLLQGVMAACAWMFARSDTLIFWMMYLGLNLIRWMTPGMSAAPGWGSAQAVLVDEMRSAHDMLAAPDFSAMEVHAVLVELKTRGAPISAVLLRVLEKRARRMGAAARQ